MENLIFDYRDPIFGVIAIFLLIFIVSFLTYTFNLIKEKNSRKSYKKLLRQFELNTLKEDDYIHLYNTYNLPFDSILLVASYFNKKGQSSKAINIYLSLLKHISSRIQKEEILELLGTTYYKNGFMQRAKDIYLKILKFSPHNVHALNFLLLVNEKLKDYTKCLEILESLNELNENTIRDYIYLNTLKIIDDPILSIEEKISELNKIVRINKVVERLYLDFLLKNNKKYFFDNIQLFNLHKIIDILWYIDKKDIDFKLLDNNNFVKELYCAKGYINKDIPSDIFEFSVMIAINQYKRDLNLDLDFTYTCTSCKKNFPIYNNRCYSCNDILTFKVTPTLIKGYYEKNSSLQ